MPRRAGKLARDGADGVIDRSQDAGHSVGPSGALKAAALFGTRVADPIWASGHGRPHQQAGHMIASDPIERTCKSSCNRGAVHIWVPLPRGRTDGLSQTKLMCALWRSNL